MNINAKFITTISNKFSPVQKSHLKEYIDLSIINSISKVFFLKTADKKLKFL